MKPKPLLLWSNSSEHNNQLSIFYSMQIPGGVCATPRGSDSADLMGPGNLHIPQVPRDSNDPGFQTILISETSPSKAPLPVLSLVRLSFLCIPGCKLVMIKLLHQ